MNVGDAIGRAARAAEVMLSRALGRPPRHMPFLVCFLTFRCNSRCRMCDFWRTPAARARDELTTDEWRQVLDDSTRLGNWVASFSGGEPLLRDDLEALVAHAAARGLTTHLCTNGVLLDVPRARALAQAGLDSVSVSLDSPIAAVHDHLRGQATFGAVVANLRAVRRAVPALRLGLNCVITRKNLRDVWRMVAFAESLGARSLRFGPIHTNLLHREKDRASFADLVLRPEDAPELDAEAAGLLEAFARSSVHRSSRPFLRGMGRVARGRKAHGCVAGFATACVDPYGFVAPCPDIQGTESVREKSLVEVWRSPAFQRLRRRVLHCPRPCWDTTYAELNLRFRLRSTLSDPRQFLGELAFYLG